MRLSQRLTTIADMLDKGGSVADIGADHALLCIYLVENELVDKAIVSEIADEPFRHALHAVNHSQAAAKISVRRGNGLQVLKPGEVDNIVIAGMGSDTMVQILSRDWTKSESYDQYIFQPMSKIHILRGCLASRGWSIKDEQVVKENGQYFIIIASSPGGLPYKLNKLEMEIGPKIILADTQVKKDYLAQFRSKYLIIYNQMVDSQSNRNILYAGEYLQRIKQLEAILSEGES